MHLIPLIRQRMKSVNGFRTNPCVSVGTFHPLAQKTARVTTKGNQVHSPNELFPTMKIKLTSLLLAGLFALVPGAQAQATNCFVFLCFGQSNMEGFPGIEESDKGPVDERFQMLAAVDFPRQNRTKGNWYPAVPPLS